MLSAKRGSGGHVRWIVGARINFRLNFVGNLFGGQVRDLEALDEMPDEVKRRTRHRDNPSC